MTDPHPADQSWRLIKRDDTFALFDRGGDIVPAATSASGLFRGGTRFLSGLVLTLEGQALIGLGSVVREGDTVFVAEATPPDLSEGNCLTVPQGTLHVLRARLVWAGALYDHVRITHLGPQSVRVTLGLRLESDFASLGAVDDPPSQRSGQRLATERLGAQLRFAYRSAEGRVRRTRVTLRPAPAAMEAIGEEGGSQARWSVSLAPGEAFHLFVEVRCETEGQGVTDPLDYETAYRFHREDQAAREERLPVLETTAGSADRWLLRARLDLDMLNVRLPTGPYPLAGIPARAFPLAREGLLAARAMLWLDPQVARGVLSRLAATQDAVSGLVDGAVDVAAGFVALAGAYARRTGDLPFVRALWPRVVAALDGIDRAGDPDGDGLIESLAPADAGAAAAGWRASRDAVFHADGRLADPPFNLCHVQARVFEARRLGADLADVLGEPARARRLREQARRLQHCFLDAFWCEELGCYALALDAGKQPCRVASSDAAHAMHTGLAAPEHAATMATRLLESDFFCGFGVRTLASGQARYNPLAGHHGAVWPHDNALLASGLARYGHAEAALRLFDALMDASGYFDRHRLPASLSGFRRREGQGPALSPSACPLHAGAATSVFALLQACLGLDIDAAQGCLSFHAPRLPAWLDVLRVRGLQAGQVRLDLVIERTARGVGIGVEREAGGAQVRVML